MTADLIIDNARILTMDSARPRAEALAVRGDRIAAIGTSAEIAALRTADTAVIDAGGATVLPGFVESHIHLFSGGVMLSNLALGHLSGFDAIRAAVQAFAHANPDAPIIIGENAAFTMFGDGIAIDRHLLDRVMADRPLAFYCADHHNMWVNTRALEVAGLLHGRELSPGNQVVMAADGIATGELREFEAIEPILRLAPTGGRDLLGALAREPESVSSAERAVDLAILRRALNYCASFGITSFHNMDGNEYQLDLLGEIDAAEGLPVRARVPFRYVPGMKISDLSAAAAQRERYRSGRLRSDFVKIFMDGVIEASTGFLLEDYTGLPGHRGVAYFDDEEFAAICVEADRLGLQIAVHAIGDGAIRRTLDGYEAARRANGPRDSRHRVEHVEVVDPADIGRFAELGVICSMQPLHAPGDGRTLEPFLTYLGKDRLTHAWAWQTLHRTGARMAFSSDWSVVPLDPLLGIQAAVTRKPILPGAADEKVSLHDAIAGYTSGGAYCEFAETEKGILRSGALADIAILSGDIETVPEDEIAALTVRRTICGGVTTYEA